MIAMRLRRGLLLLNALAVCPVMAMAAPVTSPAAALAAAIAAHYNQLHSLAVHFTQTYDGMGVQRTESGTLLLAKGGRLHDGKMRWTYTQPPGKLFVFDGKFAYFYTPGQTEVQRVPAKQLDDLRSPLALLLGHADLARQLTGMTMTPAQDGEETLRGAPKGLEQRVASLAVTASPDGVIHRMTIEGTDGARNSFSFADEIPDAPAAPSQFTFVPPPGTHVVDGEAPI